MRFLLLAALAAISAECTRAPAEDFPSRTTSPQPPAVATSQALAVPPAAAAEARCLKATPAAPPPPVAPGPAAGCPPDPEGPQKVPVLRVTFPEAGGAAVDAEFVSSEHDTQRGLMYRRSMPEGRGMLFRLEERRDQQFWMHNTCIPLDLVYVDDDGFVVGIVENAPTLNDDPRGVGCPSHYVLEVNAGWTRKHGVKAGQHMTIPPEAR